MLGESGTGPYCTKQTKALDVGSVHVSFRQALCDNARRRLELNRRQELSHILKGITMFKKIAFAATLAVLASSSFAAVAPSIYAGADIGSTKIDGISDRSTSFGAFIGYQFHENFAVEGAYRRLADFDMNFNGTKFGNVTLDQAAVSLVGTLPLSSGFNVFGRLGYNRVDATGNAGSSSSADSTSGALVGIGLGYAINARVSARVEVQKPSSDSSNLNVGVSYKF